MTQKKPLYILLPLVFLLASCSQYQKVLKSDDLMLKLQYADKYYDEEDYTKALPLYEELNRVFRGTDQAERILYRYAYTLYHVRNIQLAAFNFKLLSDQYPRGQYAEESLYMFAYSLFRLSPPPELEQSNTRRAIDAFQTFINRFPNSEKLDLANENIDMLRGRLEIKEVENAKLYYKIRDYKAAIWALQNAINQYPATEHREELELLILESHYQLAQRSIQERKEERFADTISNYNQFIRRYPGSKFFPQANNIYHNSVNELEKLRN